MWFHQRVMSPKDAEEMADGVDLDWTAKKETFELCHEIMVLFVLCKLVHQMRKRISSGARWSDFRRLPYFMCTNVEGSGKTLRI